MAWRNTVGTFMGIEKKGCIWAIIGRKSEPDSPEVVWLALGVSNLLCPFPPLPPPPFLSHCHHTHLKANSNFGERGHTLRAISSLYQDQPRKGNDSRAIANPKGPLWPKAPSWWNTIIAWTISATPCCNWQQEMRRDFILSNKSKSGDPKGWNAVLKQRVWLSWPNSHAWFERISPWRFLFILCPKGIELLIHNHVPNSFY